MTSPLEIRAEGTTTGVGYAMWGIPRTETSPGSVSTHEGKVKDEISLGDLNPLINSPDLGNKYAMEAISRVTLNLIDKYHGVEPVQLGTTLVFSPKAKSDVPRFIARFEVPDLSEEKMRLMEKLVKQKYQAAVRTRKTFDGKDIPTESYPPLQDSNIAPSKTGGWYMGLSQPPTDSGDAGLYVFKDLGKVDKDNFFEESGGAKKFIVEIREAGMYQTDLVEFITQVSTILGQEKLLDHGELLYETYYDLLRLGIRQVDDDSVYGMDEALAEIRRGLLLPLASPDLSHGIKHEPESVLLAGVPGTGKTLIVERLLQEETGLFILPVDTLQLARELSEDPKKQRLFPRIAEVARSTGRRVVLHVDDIEGIVGDDNSTKSTMLNLMAGVKNNGFYLIASTNHPNRIDPALLQPQRLGILIYCGLQNEQARRKILDIHATTNSDQHGYPLFSSEEERNIILGEVVRHTDGFTPRYLAEIVTVAKAYLAERVAVEKANSIGLTEADLEGHTFLVADWEKALTDVSSRYDKDGVKAHDRSIKEFLRHAKAQIGFGEASSARTVFSPAAHKKIAALRQNPEIN